MSTDATSSPRAALQVDPATLPDDAALLKSLVAQLFAELQSRDGRISDLEHRMSGEVTIASEVGSGTTASVVLPAA